MTSNPSSPTVPPTSSGLTVGATIEFRLRGHHIPSFKNKKMIARTPQGKQFLMTKPDVQEYMNQAIQSLSSQLSLESVTSASETETEALRQWLMSYGTEFDDNRFWLAEETVKWEEVPKGQEGADIILEVIGWRTPKQKRNRKK